MFVCVCVCACVCMHALCVHVCACVVRMCMRVCVCMCVNMCTCVCVYGRKNAQCIIYIPTIIYSSSSSLLPSLSPVLGLLLWSCAVDVSFWSLHPVP